VPAAQIGFGVDDHHRQARVLALDLLHQPHCGVVFGELEERDEEAVRSEEVRHRRADVFERAVLKDLRSFARERAPRGDADERVALEEHDVPERGLG
jgi:hypothetical protein